LARVNGHDSISCGITIKTAFALGGKGNGWQLLKALFNAFFKCLWQWHGQAVEIGGLKTMTDFKGKVTAAVEDRDQGDVITECEDVGVLSHKKEDREVNNLW
jgi:hypothetical protein